MLWGLAENDDSLMVVATVLVSTGYLTHKINKIDKAAQRGREE